MSVKEFMKVEWWCKGVQWEDTTNLPLLETSPVVGRWEMGNDVKVRVTFDRPVSLSTAYLVALNSKGMMHGELLTEQALRREPRTEYVLVFRTKVLVLVEGSVTLDVELNLGAKE